MGFLWFGKNIDSWADIGSEKDLKGKKVELEVEWNLNLTKREEAQRLYENYRNEAAKPEVSTSRKERAAYEMAQQVKRQRRLDEEVNMITTQLEDVQTILALKEAEQRDKQLTSALGNLNSDKLKDTLGAANKARQEQKDFLKDIHTIVTSSSSPITIEAEKDDDWRAAIKDIDQQSGRSF
jgi:hypothetical protein